jgi:uncharacterized Zn-binding protein involved in type VI secretion
MAPTPLIATPGTVMVEGRPVADITATAAGMNVTPFALCKTLSNPAVAAATAAALGTLTPMPCVPVVVGPWTPTVPTVLIAGKPVLTMGSMCMCAYGGQITITSAGSATTTAG